MSERKRAHDPEISSSDVSSEVPPKKVPPPENVVVIKKPLSYGSMMIILEYLDVNKRFHISSCMPAIRRIERIVPLKIDHLAFGEMSMSVNGTTYQLGMYRRLHNEWKSSKLINMDNAIGGARYDTDQFGHRNYHDEVVITPGDIAIQDLPEPSPLLTLEEHKRRLILIFPARHVPTHQERMNCPYHKLFIQKYIRRDRSLPFDNFIQLTIKGPITENDDEKDNESDDETVSDGGSDVSGSEGDVEVANIEGHVTKGIQRAPYTFKLYQAFKNLTTNFFGDTSKQLIQVRKLEFVKSEISKQMTTIRLPKGLKMKIETLKFDANIPKAMAQITPILHDSSFPLSCLEIGHIEEDEELHHPVIKNGLGKLIFTAGYGGSYTNLNIHKNIHLRGIHFRHVDLITNRMESFRDIGSCFTFGYKNKKRALQDFERIRKQDFPFVVQEERALSISVNNIAEIRLSIEEVGLDEDGHYGRSWIIKIEMVAKGAA